MTNDQNDYLRNWIFRANEDIAVIDKLFESGPELFASSICFHAQQAVEKFLKAYLWELTRSKLSPRSLRGVKRRSNPIGQSVN